MERPTTPFSTIFINLEISRAKGTPLYRECLKINTYYVSIFKAGLNLQTIEVTPNPKAPRYTPQTKLQTVSPSQAEKQGIVIECVHPAARKGKLFARTQSKKFDS